MAKTKFADKAEAKAALATAKEDRKSAKQELKAFEKENDLEVGGDHSGNKRWAKLKKAVDAKEAVVTEIEEAIEGLKSEKTVRPTKYEYPAAEGGGEMTAAEKKRYRAKMRAQKNKAEKGDAGDAKESKKSKNEKKAAAPEVAAETSSKKGSSATKKSKKEKKAAAAEPALAED